MNSSKTLLLTLVMAAPLSGAVIFTDGSFAVPPVGLSTYTEGTSSHNSYYSSGDGNSLFTVDSNIGSSAPSLVMGAFGSSLLLVVPSSGSAESWDISYDLKASSSWGGRGFEIIGLVAGNTIDNNSSIYGGTTTTTGTLLLTTQFANDTGGVFVTQNYQINVPSGLTGVGLRWFSDGGANSRYIDNISANSVTVPEPAAYGTIFALLALFCIRLRRQR